MKTFHGIIAVTVTPFDQNGRIDYPTAARHIQHLISSGVHALLPVGATGEFASFSLDERKAYAEFVIKEAAGRVPVMVGAVSQNVDTVLDIAAHAAAAGADAIMALTPPSLHLSQEEVFHFYRQLSDNVSLPVMVYNNPGSCGVDILPETMARIAALPRMLYLKESTGDLIRLTRMVNDLPFTTFCGCECLACESFLMGARGWISVLANIAPRQCVQLWNLAAEQGDISAARALYAHLLPLLRLIEESGELWQVTKYALHKQGFGNAALRAPRLPISDSSRQAVDAIMADWTFE